MTKNTIAYQINNILKKTILGTLYRIYRSKQVDSQYLRIREYFWKMRTVETPKMTKEEIPIVLNNNANKLIKNNRRVRTMAVFYNGNWEQHSFQQALSKLGEYEEILIHEYPHDVRSRACVSHNVCERVIESYKNKRADWVYFYVNGWMLLKEDIRIIKENIPVPLVIMCLDDKHNFYEKYIGNQYTGMVDICSEFDLYWTSSRLVVDWIKVLGGNPIYLPEGANPEVFYPTESKKEIDVSFIGLNYGVRGKFIRGLIRYGIDVKCYGRGWKSGSDISRDEMRSIYSKSKINLGLGYVSSTDLFTNVKGRDFEIPLSGGGVYLTTFNSDLALHYDIGKEILCYRTFEEAVELIRYYLIHESESNKIANAGRKRAISEHTWENRFRYIIDYLGFAKK